MDQELYEGVSSAINLLYIPRILRMVKGCIKRSVVQLIYCICLRVFERSSVV